MNISLRYRVMALAVAIVLATSAANTALFLSVQKKGVEREIAARGLAMAGSLARVTAGGLASENLRLMKKMDEIVHTKDVTAVQVFDNLWVAVQADPQAGLNEAPDRLAVSHFKVSSTPFYERTGVIFDFYSPIHYGPPGKRITIGYARLRMTAARQWAAMRKTAEGFLAVAAVIAAVSIIILRWLLQKFLLRPVFDLHRSIMELAGGQVPEALPVNTDNEIGALSGAFNRMSAALKQRSEMLADEKERLLVTLKSIGDGVIATDTGGRVCLMNEVAERLTGWRDREAAGQPAQDVFHIINEKTRARCENPVRKVLDSGAIVGLANHTVLVSKDGTERIIADSGAPIRHSDGTIAGVVLVFRDVTEKTRIEAELQKAQRLEAIGLLAGGIAHDFNNLLTGMLGNISVARFMARSSPDVYKRLEQTEEAFGRARHLTQQLLTFAKGGAPMKEPVVISRLMRDCASFVLSGSNSRCRFEFQEGLRTADADESQISQVINNIVLNASHAMPGGGLITLRAANESAPIGNPMGLAPGCYIRIDIEDEGPGIPADIRKRVFDPYFTTKPNGTGLGLATSYSIVSKHGGSLTVDSPPGRGACFHMYLPAAIASAACAGEKKEGMATGNERVLLMDDESIIREAAGDMLSAAGYEVEYANDGREAVSKYSGAASAGRPFEAVILDLTIVGGMSGKDAARAILDEFPEARIIVSSGYSGDPVLADFKRYGFRAALLKPYNMEQICAVVRAAVSGPDPG